MAVSQRLCRPSNARATRDVQAPAHLRKNFLKIGSGFRNHSRRRALGTENREALPRSEPISTLHLGVFFANLKALEEQGFP
jgi:hypothetical protein